MAAGLTILAVISASGFSYLLAKYLRVRYYMGKFHGPPPAHPILGNMNLFTGSPRRSFIDMTESMDLYREKQGGLMRLWIGPVPVMIIYGARHLEELMGQTEYLQKGQMYKFLEPFLGKGLVTSEGDRWYHRRKLLTPTFHFSTLQSYVSVFDQHSAILMKKLETQADKPDPFNIIPFVTYCALDIICDIAMGKHINAQGDIENEYVNEASRMGEIIMNRMKKPWLWPNFAFQLTEEGKQHDRSLKFLHGVTNKMIQERLEEAPSNPNSDEKSKGVGSSRKRMAFLDILLQMHRQDGSFTLQDVREEVDTFMFEGHHSTATTAGWAILFLGIHQDVQARVLEELDDIFGTSDRPLSADDLPKLSYLACVIKETLRLVPTVPLISRELSQDITLDGEKVPKETLLIVNFYGLHHDSEQFPEPDQFKPDRFLPENSADRHPYAFTPFSSGARNCIGQRFAMMEVKVLLANILRKFTIESVRTLEETEPIEQLVLIPQDGKILVKLHSRN